MKMKFAALSVGVVLSTASAHAQTRKTQQENLARFEKYAGAPVDQFEFWSLYKWQLVGPEKVVIWPTISQAYLVTVDSPCPGLEWANSIAVTSKQSHMVSTRFDFVKYGKGQCQISEIRPVDYKQMIADGPDRK
ncbi:MAG: DUF6491 family protein [Rhodanobacteraceae bacterium]